MNSLEVFEPDGLAYKASTREIRVLGIDLGTTNSTVAEVTWMPGKPPACRTLELDQPAGKGSQ